MQQQPKHVLLITSKDESICLLIVLNFIILYFVCEREIERKTNDVLNDINIKRPCHVNNARLCRGSLLDGLDCATSAVKAKNIPMDWVVKDALLCSVPC